MKILYFDTIAGISGDMTLGALFSAGVSVDLFREQIGVLKLPGVEIEASHVQQHGITAVKVDVIVSKQQQHQRHYHDITRLIDESPLIIRVKEDAKRIFHEVAQAEAKVHNTAIEKIHFHEVGALDSIVDIVGAAICLELLGIEKVYSSVVKLGSGGFINSEHGRLPLPGPATTEILKNYPITLTDLPFELTTPTGAAIIKACSSGVLTTEQITIESVGYGAGSHQLPNMPNLLRVIVGELRSGVESDEVLSIETNIDDMNPEVYPFVLERLFEAGALDAYIIPVIMKKGRPGFLFSVLASNSKKEEMLKILFTQTTTLGVRMRTVERRKLERTQRAVKTCFGQVTAKVVVYSGEERLVPEFEECKRIALEHNIPLVEVYKLLESEFRGV